MSDDDLPVVPIADSGPQYVKKQWRIYNGTHPFHPGKVYGVCKKVYTDGTEGAQLNTFFAEDLAKARRAMGKIGKRPGPAPKGALYEVWE